MNSISGILYTLVSLLSLVKQRAEVRLIYKIVSSLELEYGYEDSRNDDREENENKRKDDINMLESNTDRSYFMIGAVAVAGVIIAAAVFIFDTQIFGDEGLLTKTFAQLTKVATDSIGHIPDTSAPKETKMIIGLGAQLKTLLTTMPLF